MELSKQVISLELAKRLKELGVKQDSCFWWHEYHPSYDHKKFESRVFNFRQHETDFAAFTVAELGEMLNLKNWLLSTWINSGLWGVELETEIEDERYGEFEADTEADARAKLLIHLLENNLLPAASSQPNNTD